MHHADPPSPTYWPMPVSPPERFPNPLQPLHDDEQGDDTPSPPQLPPTAIVDRREGEEDDPWELVDDDDDTLGSWPPRRRRPTGSARLPTPMQSSPALPPQGVSRPRPPPSTHRQLGDPPTDTTLLTRPQQGREKRPRLQSATASPMPPQPPLMMTSFGKDDQLRPDTLDDPEDLSQPMSSVKPPDGGVKFASPSESKEHSEQARALEPGEGLRVQAYAADTGNDGEEAPRRMPPSPDSSNDSSKRKRRHEHQDTDAERTMHRQITQALIHWFRSHASDEFHEDKEEEDFLLDYPVLRLCHHQPHAAMQPHASPTSDHLPLSALGPDMQPSPLTMPDSPLRRRTPPGSPRPALDMALLTTWPLSGEASCSPSSGNNQDQSQVSDKSPAAVANAAAAVAAAADSVVGAVNQADIGSSDGDTPVRGLVRVRKWTRLA